MTGIDRSASKARTARRMRSLDAAFPPRRASATRMRRELRAYLSEQILDATVVYDVVLAADEAFINAVDHADAAGAPIHVTARVSEREASVEVRDEGRGFVCAGAGPQPAPDVDRTDGRGVFLMRRLMDEVRISSGRCGTVVRMVRRLG